MTDQILAVQSMQDYIAAHLTEEIRLSNLAEVSLFSPWYAHRLFREQLGISPADYIRRLRLSRAAEALREGKTKIIDAAYDFGFTNADTFTRAFYREFGMNPRDYLKHPVPIPLFVPYGVKFRALRKENVTMSNVQTVFVQIVRKPERLCIIKRGIRAEDYFPYCEEVGCDVWGILTSMPSLCGEPVCLWLSAKYKKPNTSTYVQGVEVETDYQGPIPQGFDVIRLPQAEYLQFQGPRFREEDYCQAIQAVNQSIREFDPASLDYAWDTENPRIQLEPRGERGYSELWPVRRILG